MHRERTVARRRLAAAALAALLLVGIAPPGAAEEPGGLRERAIALYDEGRYAEALPLLEQLDAAGQCDGPLLYRLYYCRNQAGDSRAADTLRRAIERMEQESATGSGLEAPFYLSNAYQRSGRLSDMKRIAAETTGRVERGELAQPATAVDMFRLGKLYADEGSMEPARTWYARSLEPSAQPGAALPDAYVAWAARLLADAARARHDLVETDRWLSRVAEAGGASMEDLDLLGLTRLQLGRFGEAADAWRQAERLEPARADRARYCRQLAEAAAELQPLPEVAPDGRPWSTLGQGELEQLLSERATRARDQLAAAAQPGQRPAGEERATISAALAEDHAVFVAAGLEYVLRGLDIRQAAFSGGYAPMIFHSKRWRLPGRSRP